MWPNRVIGSVHTGCLFLHRDHSLTSLKNYIVLNAFSFWKGGPKNRISCFEYPVTESVTFKLYNKILAKNYICVSKILCCVFESYIRTHHNVINTQMLAIWNDILKKFYKWQVDIFDLVLKTTLELWRLKTIVWTEPSTPNDKTYLLSLLSQLRAFWVLTQRYSTHLEMQGES